MDGGATTGLAGTSRVDRVRVIGGRRRLVGLAVVLVAGFAVIQLLPIGPPATNPPVTGEPAWDRAETRSLAVRACFDCHSNETEWPWYSYVAPMSWLIRTDVREGREAANYSEWPEGAGDADESAETVRDGEMPPLRYVLLHPDAGLSPTERGRLIDGLAATFGDDD